MSFVTWNRRTLKEIEHKLLELQETHPIGRIRSFSNDKKTIAQMMGKVDAVLTPFKFGRLVRSFNNIYYHLNVESFGHELANCIRAA